MATLFDIDKQISSLIDMETGEIMDYDAFESLSMQRTEKIENVALWVKNLTADVKDFKEQEEIFAERRKRAQRQADKLMNYLTFALNGEKFTTAKSEVNFKKSKKIEIADADLLPLEYWRVTVKVEPNKSMITKAIKDGLTVPGAELVESMNISVK